MHDKCRIDCVRPRAGPVFELCLKNRLVDMLHNKIVVTAHTGNEPVGSRAASAAIAVHILPFIVVDLIR